MLEIAYAPLGGQLAAAGDRVSHRPGQPSDQGVVRLWKTTAATGLLGSARDAELVEALAYAPLGDQLATVGRQGVVRLVDPATGDSRVVLKDHGAKVTRIAYAPSGDQIATGSSDGSVQLWDLATGDCTATLRKPFVKGRPPGIPLSIGALAYAPSGNQLAAEVGQGRITIWDLTTGDRLFALRHSLYSYYALAYSPAGTQLAVGDMSVRLLDTTAGRYIAVLRGHESTVFSVVYSPRGDLIASGGADGTVRLWRPRLRPRALRLIDLVWGLRATLTLDGQTGAGSVLAVAFSPDGRLIAGGGDDGTLRLWSIDGQRVCSIPLGERVAALTWTNDGIVAAVGTDIMRLEVVDPLLVT